MIVAMVRHPQCTSFVDGTQLHSYEKADSYHKLFPIGDLYLERSDPWQLCVHWTFVQFAFVNNTVEIYCTKNGHEILCTDDVIAAMNKALNLYSVNQNNKLDRMITEREIYDNNDNNAIAISLPSLRSSKTII